MSNLRSLPLLSRTLLTAQVRASCAFATRPGANRWTKHRRGKPGEEDDGGGGAAAAGDGVGIRFHKSRGQHILTNPRALDAIVRKAHVLPGDTVLEIGPGTGNLTLRLLQAARRVVAIEIDTRMVEFLCRRASDEGVGDRLQVISGDALKVGFPHFDLCVANIPYGISSPLVAKLLFDGGAPRRCFRSATLLLQKEFARRLAAGAGDPEFNRLAMNVSLTATVEVLMDVSKRDFVPVPKVDSSLVRIQPKPEIPVVNLEEWWALTRACFGHKNKTLGAIFKQKRKVEELFKRVQADGKASNLTIDGAGEVEEDNHDDDGAVGGGCDSNGDDDEKLRAGDEQHAEGVGLFREKILSVLKKGGFQDKRPTKLSKDDMLHLLSLFNQEGIHLR